MINLYLSEMGIAQSEFGFPTTNHDINYLNANLELAKKGVFKQMKLSGWLRAVKEDVELAYQNVPDLRNLNLSISTSEQMIRHKFQGKLDYEGIIRSTVESVKLAKTMGAESVCVNAEDASRSRMEYLVEFAQAAKEAGANRFRYCDTVSYDTPFTVYERLSKFLKEVELPIEVHCHNDLGLAVANSIAGAKAVMDAGFDVYINTCVNGIGERAGNADLVSVILAAKYGNGMEKYKLDENTDLKVAWRISKYASYALDIPIPTNHPGVGGNVFSHASGIHADGALKDRNNYELYPYEVLGRGEPEMINTGRRITLGEYSGIKGFRNVYEELEITFKDEEEARRILELARFANVHNQKPLVKDELKFVAQYPDTAKKLFTMQPNV
jgi:homocitrate synthase NifV